MKSLNRVSYEGNEARFQGRKLSSRDAKKIKYGNWADLSDEQIHKKLDHKLNRKERIDGFQIIYEELFKTPTGQYALGIAQEKTANEFIKFAKRIKNEGRRLVKANRLKPPKRSE